MLALQEYSGAVVIVSHDRHLLRTVVDEFYIVADGYAKPFDGDIEDYAKWSAEHPKADANAAPVVSKKAIDREQRKRDEAEQRKRVAPLKAEIDKLEQQLLKAQDKLKQLETELTSEDLYNHESKQRLAELLEIQTVLKRDIERIEADWMQKLEEYEQAVK